MFLGVDGGGTKTAYCLLKDDGTTVRTRGESLYYLMSGIDIVRPLLTRGVHEVCEQAGITVDQIDRAFFGFPAYGEVSADVPVLDAIPGVVLGHDRYSCANDMACGWAGSLGAADGINVVSGTGSIAYGEREGRAWRAGGWGEVFGDEGSGYWVAVQGLNAFSRMSDGRLAKGPLWAAMREALGCDADLDAVDIVINRWHVDRSRIAALSQCVAQAAADGDEASLAILRSAGAELAGLVHVIATELAYHDAVPVSYSGGLFACSLVLDAFRDALTHHPRVYDLRTPLLPPDIGAALYAARLAHNPLDPARIDITSGPSQEGITV